MHLENAELLAILFLFPSFGGLLLGLKSINMFQLFAPISVNKSEIDFFFLHVLLHLLSKSYQQIDLSGRAVFNSLVEREVKAPASEVGHEGEIWLE